MEKQNNDLFKRANEWLDRTFSPSGKKLFLVVIVLMIASLCFAVISFSGKSGQGVEEIDVVTEEIAPELDDGQSDMVDIEIEAVDDVLVSVPVEELGRANPFLPDGEGVVVARPTNIYGSSLMAPPENLSEGSDASRVITTRVSGIMYDASRPFAILNIEGQDYLVRTGDYIHNYKVLSITKDIVTVQLGKNTYKAGVGQLLSGDIYLNHNTVYDLEHRFGGAKK